MTASSHSAVPVSSATLPSGATWTAYGNGTPVTLVIGGLAATAGEARIPASGLRGTRVVLTLPSHADAAEAADGYWNYAGISADALAAADAVGASQAVGVSLGAGALTRLAATHPSRFDRLALLLPATIDRGREPTAADTLSRLASAVEGASHDGGTRLREEIRSGLPDGTDVGNYVEQRATALLRLGPALQALPGQAPLADRAALAGVTTEVLVVGAVGDPLHPEAVAKDLAAAFATARFELLDSPAPMLTHRRELRSLLTGLLNAHNSLR